MLFARTSVSTGPTSLVLHIGAAAELFVAAVKRTDSVYDTRVFGTPSPIFPEGIVVFLVLEGTLVWHPTGAVVGAPAVTVIDLPVFEGFSDDGTTFRAEGALFRAIEIRIPRRVAPPLALPRTIDDVALVDAAEAYHEGAHGDASEAQLTARARRLVVELHRVGLLPTDLTATIDKEDPPNLRPLWTGIAAMLAESGLGATLGMFADQANLSERQANRDVGAIFERLGFTYGGWRDAANRWRLRAATILLSGSESTVEAVARAVGFSGSTALGLAFRRAGLASPSRVRAFLRGEVSSPESTRWSTTPPPDDEG